MTDTKQVKKAEENYDSHVKAYEKLIASLPKEPPRLKRQNAIIPKNGRWGSGDESSKTKE